MADHPVHPALVALPIGAWIASLVFDIATYFVAEPAFLMQGARWLIAIGVLGALAAAVPGFIDLLGIPGGTPAMRTAILHMSLNLTATAGFAVSFVLRGDDTTGPVNTVHLLISAGSLLAVSAGGYLGGELVFRHGVRVAGADRPAASQPPSHPKEHA